MKHNIFPPTLLIRHRRENLKKCSLRGLEKTEGFKFLSYPDTELPDLTNYCVLAVGEKELSHEDGSYGIVLVDATWSLAQKMEKMLGLLAHPRRRSLPAGFKTAYPRRQTGCLFPNEGLASIEALFLAYHLLGRAKEGLLDTYFWREEFLAKNRTDLVRFDV